MAVVEASFLACEKATSRELIFDLDRCESRGKRENKVYAWSGADYDDSLETSWALAVM